MRLKIVLLFFGLFKDKDVTAFTDRNLYSWAINQSKKIDLWLGLFQVP